MLAKWLVLLHGTGRSRDRFRVWTWEFSVFGQARPAGGPAGGGGPLRRHVPTPQRGGERAIRLRQRWLWAVRPAGRTVCQKHPSNPTQLQATVNGNTFCENEQIMFLLKYDVAFSQFMYKPTVPSCINCGYPWLIDADGCQEASGGLGHWKLLNKRESKMFPWIVLS